MRAGRALGDGERLLLRLLAGIGGDVAVLDQALDDVVAPLDRAIAIAERVQIGGRLGQRREIGRLRDGQFVHRLVEIEQRGGRDPVGGKAEIDFVEIELEDLFLAVGALDLEREQRLLDLAVERHLVGQKEVLRDLLGDGGGALRPPSLPEVLQIEQAGARHAAEIEPGMVVEVLVLGRNEGIDDELGHRLDRKIEAPLLGVFGQQLAVGGVHPRHHRRLVILKLRIVRQVLGEMVDQAGNRRPSRR